MIDFESDTPCLYWTFNRLGDLAEGQGRYGFDGSVWRAEVIPSPYVIGEADVTLQCPAKWAEQSPVASLQRKISGQYEFRSKGVVYEAVRADTPNHVILTGKWSETDSGNGMFIAVLPLKQSVKVLLEETTAIPIETVTEMVAHQQANSKTQALATSMSPLNSPLSSPSRCFQSSAYDCASAATPASHSVGLQPDHMASPRHPKRQHSELRPKAAHRQVGL